MSKNSMTKHKVRGVRQRAGGRGNNYPTSMSYDAACREAYRRFPSPSDDARRADFMTGWKNTHGLSRYARKFLKEKYLSFGQGRRARRNYAW